MWPVASPRLLALLPLLAAVRGNCPPPPILKNAVFHNGDPGTYFPDGIRIIYVCLPKFYNVHGKLDVTQCFINEWTPIEDFCEQTCSGPFRFSYAEPRIEDRKTYYVSGTTVNYNCRAAYERIPGISSVITCLQDYTWTKLPIFCKRKSCGDPGNPKNGKAVIEKNFLYLSKVKFICNDGYRLIGSPSTQCTLKDNEVKWNKELPHCEQITCDSPPSISYGTHNGSDGTYAFHSTITYKCNDGFSLTGEASLHCITENQIDGVWNGSVPGCRINLIPQATATVTTSMFSTRREMEIGGVTNNSTPINRIEKKGSKIGIIAGISAISGIVVFAAAAAAVKGSRNIRQQRSSYNLYQSSKSMQLSETSRAEL